jgi:hypothetical protein
MATIATTATTATAASRAAVAATVTVSGTGAATTSAAAPAEQVATGCPRCVVPYTLNFTAKRDSTVIRARDLHVCHPFGLFQPIDRDMRLLTIAPEQTVTLMAYGTLCGPDGGMNVCSHTGFRIVQSVELDDGLHAVLRPADVAAVVANCPRRVFDADPASGRLRVVDAAACNRCQMCHDVLNDIEDLPVGTSSLIRVACRAPNIIPMSIETSCVPALETAVQAVAQLQSGFRHMQAALDNDDNCSTWRDMEELSEVMQGKRPSRYMRSTDTPVAAQPPAARPVHPRAATRDMHLSSAAKTPGASRQRSPRASAAAVVTAPALPAPHPPTPIVGTVASSMLLDD